MKKQICCLLVISHILVVCGSSFAAAGEYRLGAGDTIELTVVDYPKLTTKQTLSPDGQASLPLVGVVSAEGLTLRQFHRLLTDIYAMQINDPRIVINLTPKPIYVVQYDVGKDTWEVKTAKSVDEARAYGGFDPTVSVEHGSVYRVSVSKRPDFFENNWYKVITATAVMVGIYSALRK
jgi:polysaccharide export outer membrane protein